MTNDSIGTKAGLGLAILTAASCAIAETATWKGPLTGGAWSEAANWSVGEAGAERVPADGDDVVFPADLAVTDVAIGAGVTAGCASLACSGEAQITFAGDGAFKLAKQETHVTGVNGVPIVFDCVVSGYRLVPDGRGTTIHLKRDNTFTGGIDFADNGNYNVGSGAKVVVCSTAKGLGTGGQNDWVVTRNGCQIRYACSEPIELGHYFYLASGFNDCPSLHFEGPVTFTGWVRLRDRVAIMATKGDVRFVRAVTVETPGRDYCMFRGVGTNNPRFVFDEPFTGKFFWHGGGSIYTAVFRKPGNAPGTFQQGYCTIVPECADAFDATTQFDLNNRLTFNLNGCDQTVSKLWATGGTVCNTSSAPATLTLDYGGEAKGCGASWDAKNAFAGTTAGPLNFVWAPKNGGDYAYTIEKATWNATGTVGVVTGTLRIKDQDLPNVTSLEVTGGTLSLEGAVSVNPALRLNVSIGGRVALAAGTSFSVDGGEVRGVQLMRGVTYTGAAGAAKGLGEALDGLEGEGTVCVLVKSVEPVAATWTGTGSDTLTTTPANWQGGALPDFTEGSLVATVAGGREMTLAGDAAFRGFVFAGGEAAFTVKGRTGDEKLQLLGSGLAAEDWTGAGVRTNRFVLPIRPMLEQTWRVGANTCLCLDGGADFAGGLGCTKTGAGTLALTTANGFTGDFHLQDGTVDVWADDAFGSTAGRVCYERPASSPKPTVILHGVRNPRPIVVTSYGNPAGETGSFVAVAGTTNELAGALSQPNGNFILQSEANARLVVSGGWSGNWLMARGAGDVVLTNAPVTKAGGVSAIACYNAANLYVHSQSNACGYVDLGHYASGIFIHLMAPDCFRDTTALYFSHTKDDRFIDLHGHDQAIGPIRGAGTTGTNVGRAGIRSDAPATLTVNQKNIEAARTDVLLAGPISLVKAGPEPLAFTRADLSSLTGTVTCVEGTLAFAATGQLPNVTNLVVSGTGVVSLPASEILGKKSAITVAESGRLDLAEGVTQTCRYLYVPGRPGGLPAGTYGSADSPADDKTYAACFTGTGIVRVKGDGTVIVIR